MNPVPIVTSAHSASDKTLSQYGVPALKTLAQNHIGDVLQWDCDGIEMWSHFGRRWAGHVAIKLACLLIVSAA